MCSNRQIILSLAACCLALGLPGQSEPPAQAETLSLEAALQGALSRNFAVRLSEVDSQVAAEGVREAAGVFDPRLTAEYSYSNTNYLGLNKNGEDSSVSVGVSGLLPTGTEYAVGINGSDTFTPFGRDDTPDRQEFTGDLSGTSAYASITQPLMSGFRSNANRSRLVIARRQRDQGEEAFRATVIDTVTETVGAFHDLYFAERNLAIAERNRANASQLLQDNRRRVDAGAMAPLDIYQAESEVAVRTSVVISARQQRRGAENRLKGLIMNDAASVLDRHYSVADLPPPSEVEPHPAHDYATALEWRPDYQATLAQRDIREVEVERDRWAARPQVDFFARASRYSSAATFGESLHTLDDRGTDNYSVGLVFSHPLFNRTSEARRATSYLRRNQAELLQRQLEQQIMLDLDNAAAAVTAAWERVESTRLARDLAQKSLEAEEKKLQIGTSSTFVVLRLQSDLANAEIRELASIVDYYTALASYERARGTTLQAFHLELH